jgi:hypothetical protein
MEKQELLQLAYIRGFRKWEREKSCCALPT